MKGTDFINGISAYTKAIISDKLVDINAQDYQYYNNTIPNFTNQAIYIYSLKENKLLFTKGWEDALGYKDEEITMFDILATTSPKYKYFINELNAKALMFLRGKTQDLEEYSLTMEFEKIHKNGNHIPLFARISIFKAENGRIDQIIGMFQVVETLKLGGVMKYSAYGPGSDDFEKTLNKNLFKKYDISSKEKEALILACRGLAFKEIAHKLGVSQSAVEKRILPLYKRFKVFSLPHLISFAYENNLL